MQLVKLRAILAAVWVVAVLIAGFAMSPNSLSTWAVLAGVALVPPVVVMWRWHSPNQTLSESIQEARR